MYYWPKVYYIDINKLQKKQQFVNITFLIHKIRIKELKRTLLSEDKIRNTSESMIHRSIYPNVYFCITTISNSPLDKLCIDLLIYYCWLELFGFVNFWWRKIPVSNLKRVIFILRSISSYNLKSKVKSSKVKHYH